MSANEKSSFNQFLAHVVILYSLKTPEDQRFSSVFRGYNMGTLSRWRCTFQQYLTIVDPSTARKCIIFTKFVLKFIFNLFFMLCYWQLIFLRKKTWIASPVSFFCHFLGKKFSYAAWNLYESFSGICENVSS